MVLLDRVLGLLFIVHVDVRVLFGNVLAVLAVLPRFFAEELLSSEPASSSSSSASEIEIALHLLLVVIVPTRHVVHIETFPSKIFSVASGLSVCLWVFIRFRFGESVQCSLSKSLLSGDA